jgi:competence protein ComEA
MNVLKSILFSILFAFAAHASAQSVNLNTADATQLASLNGVGEAKAEAIIAWRQANGPFRSVEQLAEVKGIGLKTVEKNRERLTVGGSAQPARPAAAKPAAT